MVPVHQRGLIRVLAVRAGEYDVNIRWGHVVRELSIVLAYWFGIRSL